MCDMYERMAEYEDPETTAVLEASRFWVQKVFIPIFVGIGVLGNTITVMVLTRRRMRNSTNIYLSALAIADIIHLLFVFVLSFTHYTNIHDIKYELYWRFYGLSHWILDAASSTSAWLTVSFTIERYIAVCHPIKGKFLCTERRAKTVIVIVSFFCILTTATTTFEHQISLNDTCVEKCKFVYKNPQNYGHINHNDTTVDYYGQHHAFIGNSESRSSSASDVTFDVLTDKYLRSQLSTILSNCTSHPHIIYIPIFPQIYNSSGANSHPTTDDSNSEGTTKVNSKIQEFRKHNLVEKPPDLMDTREVIERRELLENLSDILTENTTCCIKKYTIGTESTQLGNNETYTLIMYWYSSIFFCLVPLTLIATFNCFLVRTVYTSQQIRRVMTSSQESISRTNEKRITLMLIGVVVIFLICHTPTASILIYNCFHKAETRRNANIKLVLGNFFNFLMIVNPSCNFLLYCVLSKKFRSTFKKLFFERRRKRQDMILLSSTKSKNSQKFIPHMHGLMTENVSEYQTPRNLETRSLTSIPRSKSLIVRPIGKARSNDLNV